jgi:beta-lactamase regulating signal transducer with metallopeptidase domain
MKDVLATALAFLGTYAVHGTIIVLLAAAVAALGRQRLAASTALWKFGLAAGAVTAALQLLLAPATTFDLAPLLAAPVADLAALPSGLQPPVAASALLGDVAMPAAGVPPVQFGLVAAAVGLACLGLGGLLRAQARLRAVLADRQPENDSRVLLTAAAVARQMSLPQTPRLSRSHVLRTPVAFGIGAPEICLPARIGELGDDELRAMLAHELSHLTHRDSLWLWLGALLQALFPWHLPLRLARSRLHHATELRCDALAAETAGGVAVANCLLVVAEWMRGAPAAPAGALAMAARPSSLRRRVEAALAGDGRCRRHPVMALLLATAAIATFVAAVPGVRLHRDAAPALAEQPAGATPATELQAMALELAAEHADLQQQVASLRAEIGAAAASPELAAMLQELTSRLQALERARTRLTLLLTSRARARRVNHR